MKTKVRNSSKCLWTACIAAMAVCMTMSTPHVQGAANLGEAYISNVVSVPAVARNIRTFLRT